MSLNPVKVRTIRPHDTSDGLRAPGDEYERSKADADMLAKAGVVAIIPGKASTKANVT